MLRTKTVEWGDYRAVVQEQSGLQFLTETETFLHLLSRS